MMEPQNDLNRPKRIQKTQIQFQNEFGPSVTTCVLSIYNLKLDRDCGQHSNSQSTYLCVLLRNQNWLKIGQLTSIARALYFLSPNLETQWSKMFKTFKTCTYCSKKFLVALGYYSRPPIEGLTAATAASFLFLNVSG